MNDQCEKMLITYRGVTIRVPYQDEVVFFVVPEDSDEELTIVPDSTKSDLLIAMSNAKWFRKSYIKQFDQWFTLEANATILSHCLEWGVKFFRESGSPSVTTCSTQTVPIFSTQTVEITTLNFIYDESSKLIGYFDGSHIIPCEEITYETIEEFSVPSHFSAISLMKFKNLKRLFIGSNNKLIRDIINAPFIRTLEELTVWDCDADPFLGNLEKLRKLVASRVSSLLRHLTPDHRLCETLEIVIVDKFRETFETGTNQQSVETIGKIDEKELNQHHIGIHHLRNLRVLTMSNTMASFDGLLKLPDSCMMFTTLRELNFSHTSFNDEHLIRFTGLQKLNIRETEVKLSFLTPRHPYCVEMTELITSKYITDEQLAMFRNLDKLSIVDSPATLTFLCEPVNETEPETEFKTKHETKLHPLCHTLTDLDAIRRSPDSPMVSMNILHCQKLRSLSIANLNCDIAEFDPTHKLFVTLEELDISDTNISDVFVSRFTRLSVLKCWNSKVKLSCLTGFHPLVVSLQYLGANMNDLSETGREMVEALSIKLIDNIEYGGM